MIMAEEKETVVTDTAEENEVKTETNETPKKNEKKKDKAREAEAENVKLKEALAKAEAALSESEDKYKRVLAEYDNYRKRTAKEKEGVYSDAYGDAIKEILPVIDNLERAAMFEDGEQVAKGVKMTLAQFLESLGRMGVEVIDANKGDPFDPVFHNAVMHSEDPELGEGVISAVLQKGYKKGDKVYRYAMVAVAN